MIPDTVSWTHAPPQYVDALFLESCWIHNFALQFPEASIVSLFLSCKAKPHSLELPMFSFIFDGFFFFRIDETNASQSSSIIELWFSRLPILAFLSSERLYPFWTRLKATNCEVSQMLEFLLVSSRTIFIPLDVFLSMN